MTNNDHLNNITGEIDTPEISAVKMILTRIDEDLENDLYEENRDKYLNVDQHIIICHFQKNK